MLAYLIKSMCVRDLSSQHKVVDTAIFVSAHLSKVLFSSFEILLITFNLVGN